MKHAVLIAQQPLIAANESLPLMLTTTSPASVGPTVDLHNFPSSSVTVSLSITRPATQSFSVDVSQALKDALSSNSVSYFFQGPLATQGRVVLPVIVSSFRMAFDVTLFSDNTFSVDIQFLNDIAMSPVGGTLVYDTTISANGATVYNALNLTHYQYQTWHYVYYSDQEPRVNVQYDILGLIQANVIQPYNYTNGIHQRIIDDAVNQVLSSPTWGQPFDKYSVTRYMPMTGGRPDIGPAPLWAAAWVISQNNVLRQVVLGWGEAAGSVPWNYFAKNTSRWLNVFDYPGLWYDTRCAQYSVCPTQWTEEDSWTPDIAHLPSLAYIPYLITGRRYYLDRMEAVAAWAPGSHWDALRSVFGPTELGLVYGEQLRGAAWALREIVLASYISPDDSSLQDYYERMMFNHMSWLVNQTAGWQSQSAEIYGYMLNYNTIGYPGGAVGIAAWQNDFFTSTISMVARRGNEMAKQYLRWSRTWNVGRFTHEPQFKRHNAISSGMYFGNGTYFVQTWAELQHEQEIRGWDNVNFASSGGYYAQVAEMSLVLHQIEDPTDTEAASAHAWLLSSGAPYSNLWDLRNDPTFG